MTLILIIIGLIYLGFKKVRYFVQTLKKITTEDPSIIESVAYRLQPDKYVQRTYL